MTNDTASLRQINANVRRKFRAAANQISTEICAELKARAVAAVASGEPHKATGGWVILPFTGQADIRGLLEIASRELRAAQMAAFNS